nr:hypothetical protein [Tanacetum cinerariifolium]
MIAILEKYEHNQDFLQIVDFVEASHIRQYTKRTRIAQFVVLLPAADEPASPLGGVSQGRRLDEGEEAAKRVSDDTEEMATVLTSMDAASILTSGGVQVVPTAAKVATATISIPTGSEVVSTASPIIPITIARDAKVASIHAEEELQMMNNSLDGSNEIVAKYLQEYEQIPKDLSIGERIELISDLVKYQENYAQVLKYQTLQREPRSKKQKKDYYMAVHTEGQRSYWKITRLGGSSVSYQFFVDMLKHLDRENLNQLWRLVKEFLSIRPAASDKEMEVYVEPKRLYKPDVEDQLWTHTQNLMHAPVEWKLYDTCGVHHVTSKDKEIFMLVEKDYPFRKGLAIVMICYKLQVENYFQMANDLILKIYKIVNYPRRIVRNKMHKAFPMSEEVPTASKESSHCQKKRDATSKKIALLLKSSSNCQSKSYDSYAKLVPHV